MRIRAYIRFVTIAAVFVATTCLTPLASAATKSVQKPYGAPKDDKALAYFIRPKRFAAALDEFYLYIDEQFFGALANNCYTYTYLDPGERVIRRGKFLNRQFKFESGKTYYFTAWEQILDLPQEEGVRLIEKVKFYCSPSDGDIQIAKANTEERVIEQVTDQDGQAYEAVTIGNQIWMAENLNVSTLRNGEPMFEARTNEDWKKAGEEGKPAWCHYDNSLEIGQTYGKLYNWYAVRTAVLCPTGWHVPTDNDWRVLDLYTQVNDLRLKETGNAHWERWIEEGVTIRRAPTPNLAGFEALPGGMRSAGKRKKKSAELEDVGFFYSIGSSGVWWSSTGWETEAVTRSMNNRNNDLSSSGVSKSFGFSVRCIKVKDVLGSQLYAEEKLRAQTSYTGLQREFYPNGNKEREGNWVKGKRVGRWVFWYESGQKSGEGNWVNGERDGTMTGWYENGHKAVEANYVNGGQHGTATRWYEGGQKEVEGNFVNGKLEGRPKWWDEVGNEKPGPKSMTR
jgi:uncharacterized protein (TIGR02145 family)